MWRVFFSFVLRRFLLLGRFFWGRRWSCRLWEVGGVFLVCSSLSVCPWVFWGSFMSHFAEGYPASSTYRRWVFFFFGVGMMLMVTILL